MTPNAVPLVYATMLAAGVNHPEIDAWLRAGVARYLAQDGAITLEAALGLPRRGPSKAMRDFWLAAAANHFHGSSYKRGEALLEAVQKFEGRTWPSWCNHKAPPAYAEALEQALFHAFKTGISIPGTAQGLMKILDNQNPVSS